MLNCLDLHFVYITAMLLQCQNCISVSYCRVKLILRCVLKCENFGCHFLCQSLLLGINIPNDDYITAKFQFEHSYAHFINLICILSLYFLDGPVIENMENNFMIEEGRTLSIPLSVNVNPQPDSINLYYQGVTVFNQPNVFTNSTVIEFMNISRNQTGEYSLEISNNISTALYNFTVNVTCELIYYIYV